MQAAIGVHLGGQGLELGSRVDELTRVTFDVANLGQTSRRRFPLTRSDEGQSEDREEHQ